MASEPKSVDAAGPIPVVFLLSSNYSGSHLLAQTLGAHSACADVGELGNLEKFRSRRRSRGTVENSSGTQDVYDTTPPFTALRVGEELQWHRTLLDDLAAAEPGLRVLVDNSKRPRWLRRIAAGDGVRPVAVHLLRDPRAVAWRWQRTFAAEGRVGRFRWREARRRPSRAASILTASAFAVYGYRWLRENEAIRQAAREIGCPVATVDYESLTAAPEAVLRRLMADLGLDFEAAQLDYGAARQWGTSKPDWRDVAARSEWQTDRRWHADVEAGARREIEQIAPLRAFLAELGYTLEPDTLRRTVD